MIYFCKKIARPSRGTLLRLVNYTAGLEIKGNLLKLGGKMWRELGNEEGIGKLEGNWKIRKKVEN